MKITDVKIKRREEDSKIIAVAAVTFDDCFVVHGINVIEGQKGMFIAMPSRKINESVYIREDTTFNKNTLTNFTKWINNTKTFVGNVIN